MVTYWDAFLDEVRRGNIQFKEDGKLVTLDLRYHGLQQILEAFYQFLESKGQIKQDF